MPALSKALRASPILSKLPTQTVFCARRGLECARRAMPYLGHHKQAPSSVPGLTR